MTQSMGPFQAEATYLHLGPDGTAVPLDVDAAFWEKLSTGGFAHLGPGRLVSAYTFTADWTSWEQHPAGEEVVVLMAGALELVLQAEDGERRVDLHQPGQFLLVPRGAWHTANVAHSATALFITPGEGTRHRPRTT
jgi:hypothetical protein